MRCASGEPRFRQREREVAALGRRELAAAAITSSRIPAAAPPASDLNRALAELAQVAARLARRQGDVQAQRERVQALVPELNDSKARLELASAELGQEERALTLQADGLRHHAYLAQELDRALEAALPQLPDEQARTVRGEILFPVRQRRQDLLLQLAIVSQALAAVRLTISNNRSVIHSVETATMTALAAAASPFAR